MADDDHRLRAGPVVALLEPASEDRGHPNDVEQVGRG
jgi:hypothetical protein